MSSDKPGQPAPPLAEVPVSERQAGGWPTLIVEFLSFFRLLSVRRIARWLLIAALLYAIWWLISNASSALIPFFVGIVLAYLMLPLVNLLSRYMPRWGSILVVYAFTLLAVGLFIGFLVPPLVNQFSQLIERIPSFERIRVQFEALMVFYQKTITSLPDDVRTPVEQGINDGLASAQSNLTTSLQGIGTFLLNSVIQVGTTIATTVTFLLGFLLIPFWLFYTMMDQQRGLEFIDVILPRRVRADFWAVVTIVDRVLSGYVRGQLLLGAIVGLAAGLGLTVLSFFGFEVPYILLLAVLAAITELIPVIGPIIGAVPAIILGFLDAPTTGIAVTILYILIQQLENNLLVPRIVGDSVDLHPAVLMVLLVVYSQIFGLVGAIISAPFTAMVRDVFIYLYGRLSEPPQPAGLLPARLRPAPATPDPPPKPASGESESSSPEIVGKSQ